MFLEQVEKNKPFVLLYNEYPTVNPIYVSTGMNQRSQREPSSLKS